MRVGSFALLLLPLLANSPVRAADTYCRTSHYTVLSGDGSSGSVTWYVTAASGRHLQNLMQPRPTTGCSWDMRSIGGMPRAPELLSAPRLGKVTFPRRYRVFYTASRAGSDAFDLRFFWLGRTGQMQSGTVHFDVSVTAGPI